MSVESLGRELARQIHLLDALREERRVAMQQYKLQEESIQKEIHRLALEVRMGQGALFDQTRG